MTTTPDASRTPQTTPDTLSDAKIASYQERGFVHIPGVITPEEAAQYYEAALEDGFVDLTNDIVPYRPDTLREVAKRYAPKKSRRRKK